MVLSFRIGKVPVQILPSFFLVALFLGAGGSRASLGAIALWVAIVLASVLLHELGHASAGLLFGLEPRIQLHGMGGTTSWARPQPLSTAQRVAISLAGPAAGFAIGALVFALQRPLLEALPGDLGPLVVAFLLWVNVGWGILNLLPMLPLDGGNAMAHVLNGVTGGRGERPARIVSIVLAAVCATVAAATQWWWSAVLAASFVYTNWRGLKELAATEHDAPLRATLERAYAALDAKDAAQVLNVARSVALESQTAPVRAEALQLVAFGFLLEGRVADADAALAAMPKGFAPHPSLVRLREDARSGQARGA